MLVFFASVLLLCVTWEVKTENYNSLSVFIVTILTHQVAYRLWNSSSQLLFSHFFKLQLRKKQFLKTMKIINLTKTLWNTLQNLITWCVGLKLKESLWKWSWILAFWTTALIPPESTVPMTNIVSNPPKIIIVNTKSVHKTRVLPVRKKKIRLWSFCWSLSFLSCLYLTDF